MCFRCLRIIRKIYREACAVPGFEINFDPAVMQRNNFADHGKTESVPLCFMACIIEVELIKDMRFGFFIHTRSVIRDRSHRFTAVILCQTYRDGFIVTAEFSGIVRFSVPANVFSRSPILFITVAVHAPFTEDFLQTLIHCTNLMNQTGLISGEEYASMAGKSFLERVYDNMNLLSAVGVISALRFNLASAFEPAYLIAIAGGCTLIQQRFE